MTQVKRSRIHTGDLQVCATYLYVCVCRCDRLRVCVLTDAGAMRVSLCAFWSLVIFLMGGKKDNATVERGVRGKRRRERMGEEVSQESWVWISLKCSIWWVIIFTKAAKSILFPKGVTATHSFLPVLTHSFLPEWQLMYFIFQYFRWLFYTWSWRNVRDLLDLPQAVQYIPFKWSIVKKQRTAHFIFSTSSDPTPLLIFVFLSEDCWSKLIDYVCEFTELYCLLMHICRGGVCVLSLGSGRSHTISSVW